MMMCALRDEMPAFRALSDGDKFRVSRLLVRGKAPSDPRMAAAAVELAESYHCRGRAYKAFSRWVPVLTAIWIFTRTIPGAIEGGVGDAILVVVVILGAAGNLVLNLAMRPKNVARSLDASRRIASLAGG